ncbi:MAG: hypothetical protein QXO76_03540 [Thermoproteota archaeon]
MMSEDRSAEEHLDEMLRKLREENKKLKRGKVSVHAWWEDKHDKLPVRHEHEVEFIKRWKEERRTPDPEAYVLLKFDGREVKVERFTLRDWKEWEEREKRESLRTQYAWIDYIRVNDAIVDHLFMERDRGKVKVPSSLKRVLVIYRLLWYFGPSYQLLDIERSACSFLIKYRGYVFQISDRADSLDYIEMSAWVIVPSDVKWDFKAEERYRPPWDVCEEILAIVEFLAKYPVWHREPVTFEYMLT